MEGYYQIDVDIDVISSYSASICDALMLKAYGEPVIYSPEGLGKSDNQGFDAFLPLIDSGISLYVWSQSKFFSIVIYTCKSFDDSLAVETTKRFFDADQVATMSF